MTWTSQRAASGSPHEVADPPSIYITWLCSLMHASVLRKIAQLCTKDGFYCCMAVTWLWSKQDCGDESSFLPAGI